MSDIVNNDADRIFRGKGSGSWLSPPPWQQSSFCDMGDCVVLAPLDGYVAVPDPHDPTSVWIVPERSVVRLKGCVAIANSHSMQELLIVNKGVLAAWIQRIKAGEFDHLMGLDNPY